eukprot:10477-Amphidinium_carterae.1
MHDASLAEVLAEMEELEALSTPRFNKIETSEFEVHSLKPAMDGQPAPMQTQTANFPNPTPSAAAAAAAAASPMPGLNFSMFFGTGGGDGSAHPQPGTNQGYGYESFGEQTNNFQRSMCKLQQTDHAYLTLLVSCSHMRIL